MSDNPQDTFYGVKLAAVDNLAALADKGSDLARDELRSRLPSQLLILAKLYGAAYGAEHAAKAMVADLDQLKTSDKFENGMAEYSPWEFNVRVVDVW